MPGSDLIRGPFAFWFMGGRVRPGCAWPIGGVFIAW